MHISPYAAQVSLDSTLQAFDTLRKNPTKHLYLEPGVGLTTSDQAHHQSSPQEVAAHIYKVTDAVLSILSLDSTLRKDIKTLHYYYQTFVHTNKAVSSDEDFVLSFVYQLRHRSEIAYYITKKLQPWLSQYKLGDRIEKLFIKAFNETLIDILQIAVEDTFEPFKRRLIQEVTNKLREKGFYRIGTYPITDFIHAYLSLRITDYSLKRLFPGDRNSPKPDTYGKTHPGSRVEIAQEQQIYEFPVFFNPIKDRTELLEDPLLMDKYIMPVSIKDRAATPLKGILKTPSPSALSEMEDLDMSLSAVLNRTYITATSITPLKKESRDPK